MAGGKDRVKAQAARASRQGPSGAVVTETPEVLGAVVSELHPLVS